MPPRTAPPSAVAFRDDCCAQGHGKGNTRGKLKGHRGHGKGDILTVFFVFNKAVDNGTRWPSYFLLSPAPFSLRMLRFCQSATPMLTSE